MTGNALISRALPASDMSSEIVLRTPQPLVGDQIGPAQAVLLHDSDAYEVDDKHVEDDNAILRSQLTFAQSRSLLRRADWRILPILILLYLSKNMDGNIVSVGPSRRSLSSLH